MYAIPAFSLVAKQMDKLNVCWNSVIRIWCLATISGSRLVRFYEV